MKKESKNKLISGILTLAIGATGVTAFNISYNKDVNFKRQTNKFICSTFLDIDYSVPNGIKYSDFNSNDVYYVHRNDKRTIISSNKYVEGYNCLGLYDSNSSADAIFYITYSTDGGETLCCKPISYDDIEKDNYRIFQFVNDLALIDENSPDSACAFIPEHSIKKTSDNVSKTMVYYWYYKEIICVITL